MSEGADEIDDVPDEVIIKVTDFVDGTLKGAEKDEVAKKIADDPVWKRTHDEMIESKKTISQLRKAKPPEAFVENVTETINKRSQGRFFGRQDRLVLPLTVIAVLALIVIAYVMWSAQSGPMNTHHEQQGSAVDLRPGL